MPSSQSPESEEDVNSGSCKQRSVSEVSARLKDDIEKLQREVRRFREERDLNLEKASLAGSEWQPSPDAIFRKRAEYASKKVSELEVQISALSLELLITEWFGPVIGLGVSSRSVHANMTKVREPNNLGDRLKRPVEFQYLEYRSAKEKEWFVDVSNQLRKNLENADMDSLLSIVEPKRGAKPLKFLPQKLRLLLLDVLSAQCRTNRNLAEKHLAGMKTRRAELLQLSGQAKIRFSHDKTCYILPVLDDLYEFMDEQILSSGAAVDAYSSRIDSIAFFEHLDCAYQSVLIKNGLLDKRIFSGVLDPSTSYGCEQFAKSIVGDNQKTLSSLEKFEKMLNDFYNSARSSDSNLIKGLEYILEILLSMREAEAVSRDCLRRARNRPLSYCRHPEALFSQHLSTRYGVVMTKAMNFVAPVFTKTTADIVAQVNSMNEKDDLARTNIEEVAKNHLVLIFKYLELILENETFRREDINFWKHGTEGESAKYKAIHQAQFEQSASCLAFLEQHKSFYNACRKKLEEVLIKSGIHESLADRRARKSKEKNAPVEAPEELSFRVTSLAKIEPALVRVSNLLRRIDSLFQGPKSRDVESQASDVLIQADRDECRSLLAELLSVESQLRSLVCVGILEEKEKIDLWQRRVLVAEKIDDSYLALRARRRLQIHEESLRLLRTALSEDLDLPESFNGALAAVEAVERSLGLVANTIPGRTNVVAAMTLFDRILFLSENLLHLMKTTVNEDEQGEQIRAECDASGGGASGSDADEVDSIASAGDESIADFERCINEDPKAFSESADPTNSV